MEIKKPTVIIDETRARRNIQRVADRAKKSGTILRPHFKTHQSAEIGEWFKDYGVTCISTSSVDMTRYFADHGWDDISLCIVVNPLQIKEINELAGRIILHLLVESVQGARFLAEHMENKAKVWIEVDAGYHRTGIDHQDLDLISNVTGIITKAPLLSFEGILTHPGNSYSARSHDEIKAVFERTMVRFTAVRDELESRHGVKCKISLGDTPTCSVVDDFGPDVDEIRPGNFIFYDIMQERITACDEDDVAASVACIVISKQAARGEFVIYGGGVHLSKDFIVNDNGERVYGKICLPGETPFTRQPRTVEGAFIFNLSQEHGRVRAPVDFINSLEIGDVLHVLPAHSCYTINLHSTYCTSKGKKIDGRFHI